MGFHHEDERHDALIAAIDRAGHNISRALTEGFKLVALQLVQTPVDNSASIETSAKKLKALADQLHKSIPIN